MKYIEILTEKLLKGEFSFGFELEAISSIKRTYREIEDTLSPHFNNAKIEIDSDITIAKDVGATGQTFELKSPVMRFSPINIKNIVNFLNNLPQLDIYTNNTCGFHVHFSFPNMTPNDLIWILSHIALSPEVRKKLEYFHNIPFFNSDWADNKYLNEIYTAINDKNFDELSKLFSNTKYRTFKIHEQGTLEWRGPRDFLNTPNLEKIKDFFRLVTYFVNFMINTLEITSISDMDKKEYLSKIIQDTDFQFNVKDNSKLDSLYKKILKNVKIFFELPKKYQIKVIKTYNTNDDYKLLKLIGKNNLLTNTLANDFIEYSYGSFGVLLQKKYPLTLDMIAKAFSNDVKNFNDFLDYGRYLNFDLFSNENKKYFDYVMNNAQMVEIKVNIIKKLISQHGVDTITPELVEPLVKADPYFLSTLEYKGYKITPDLITLAIENDPAVIKAVAYAGLPTTHEQKILAIKLLYNKYINSEINKDPSDMIYDAFKRYNYTYDGLKNDIERTIRDIK